MVFYGKFWGINTRRCCVQMQNHIVTNSELTFIKDVTCYPVTAVAFQVITLNLASTSSCVMSSYVQILLTSYLHVWKYFLHKICHNTCVNKLDKLILFIREISYTCFVARFSYFFVLVSYIWSHFFGILHSSRR